jgi:hypothetical protein
MEQLGYFGLKGMGLFGHLQMDTKRLKKRVLAFEKTEASEGLKQATTP